jgi:hypothetical protein
VALGREHLAGLQFGEAGEPDLAVTVNENRLAGRLARGPVSFKLSAGPSLEVEAETIRAILFQRTEGEGAEWPSRQYLRLTSGETLTGRISPDPLTLRTAEGEVSVARADLAFLGGPTGDRPFARAALVDGRAVDGDLLNETFEIVLDLGPTLTVKAKDVDFLMGADGQRPREPEQVGGVRVVRVTSTKDVNVGLRGEPAEAGGLRVVEVTSDSPFAGVLEPGDVIVQVGGGGYGEGVLTRAVWDMLLGNRNHVELGFVRGGQPDRILLMRGEKEEETITTDDTDGTDSGKEENAEVMGEGNKEQPRMDTNEHE